MIGKTKTNALIQFVANSKKEMHKYKEADLKYDLARGFLECNNSKTSNANTNKKRNNKRTKHDGDDGDTKLNKRRRKICIDCDKTENELRVKRKRDYLPHEKRKRNEEVYRNNR